MTSEPDFADLLAGLRKRNEDAAAEVFGRFAQKLVNLASRRIVGHLRRKLDAEDLVQSAFRSFFRVGPADAFEFEGWDDLWSVLATITLRKCDNRVRHYLTKKRSVSREVAAEGDDAARIVETLGREPTPAETAMFSDLVANLLDGLDDTARAIAELTLQGASPGDIAAAVGVTKRTVFRQMERIRARLAKISAEGESPA